MTKAVPMRKIHEARRQVLHGYSVKEISEKLKMSESTVRLYTKSERARMSERREKV